MRSSRPLAARGVNAFLQGSNRDAAAPSPHQPHAPDQILVSLTHRVVMNLQAARQFAHAGQRLPGLQLARGDVKDDLQQYVMAIFFARLDSSYC